MVIWRTTARTGHALRTRSLSSSAVKAQAIDFSKAVEDFKTNGVAILPLKMEEEYIGKSRDLCMAAWKEALERAHLLRGGDLQVGMEHGFKEVVQRAQGRYDLHWGVNGVGHFLDAENILNKFLPFVHEVFGGAHMTKMDFNGCLMSLPGAKEQLWHVDGEHLYTSEPDLACYGSTDKDNFFKDNSAILPAHCLNVFVPLVDVEGRNGGTEFCLGSHFHSKFMAEDIVWQDDSWKERIGFDGEILQIKVNAGEVLAFDYRTLHRALEHGGVNPRPLLYYTFTKRWFSDAMNFADLPSLKEADHLVKGSGVGGLAGCRSHFPALNDPQSIICDGAAGSQVPNVVVEKMANHLQRLGATNVGGEYPSSSKVLETVSKAREAGSRLLGASSSGEIAFGQNCTNLMFHLASALQNTPSLQPGDNIILSRACHDANIAPWLLLANRLGLEVRWLEVKGGSDDSTSDELVVREDIIDSRTRLISMGLASNATGRLHTPALDKLQELMGSVMGTKPLLVLDCTHYVPHRRTLLKELGADVLVCSAYKFFGPHLGLMAFDKDRLRSLQPSKVGLRWGEGGLKDLLDYGELPEKENCEISRWELGTLNYEALAGFCGTEEYLAGLAPDQPCLDAAFSAIVEHEEKISAKFLEQVQPLLEAGKLRLLGSTNPTTRTPTFALSQPQTSDPTSLVRALNEAGVRCTHGNHYAVSLVDEALASPQGVTRLSFMHYNTLEEVERVADIIKTACSS